MTYTVHWAVNDGRYGYPNITADLSQSDIECCSYQGAIRAHAKNKGVKKILSISEMIGKGSEGKINGRNYRDYLVAYIANDEPLEKEIYLDGEVVSKIVRVFGSYAKKKPLSCRTSLYP
ncbi:MAG: hypothetical protein RR576_10060 [Oscillospiraceae bacterium]